MIGGSGPHSESPMWRTGLDFCLIGAISTFACLMTWVNRAPGLIPIAAACLTASVVNLILVWLLRFQLKDRVVSCLMVSEVLVLLFLIVANHDYYIHRSNIIFSPYIGLKFLALLIGVLAPSRRSVGFFLLTLVAAVPIAQYYSWTAELRLRMGIQEPWISELIVVASGLIYLGRLKVNSLRQSEADSAARAVAYQNLCMLFAGLQHLTNTPLQTIELSTEMIHHQFPAAQAVLEPMQNSFATLREISRLLEYGSSHANWDQVNPPPSTLADFERDLEHVLREFKR